MDAIYIRRDREVSATRTVRYPLDFLKRAYKKAAARRVSVNRVLAEAAMIGLEILETEKETSDASS